MNDVEKGSVNTINRSLVFVKTLTVVCLKPTRMNNHIWADSLIKAPSDTAKSIDRRVMLGLYRTEDDGRTGG